MSRDLASNDGVAFRLARAMQDCGKPTFRIFLRFCSREPLLCSHAATAAQHSLEALPVDTATDTTYEGVGTNHACVLCLLRVRVCKCSRICALCWRLKELLLARFLFVVLSRKIKHTFMFIVRPQRYLHFRPVVCHREARRRFEHL